VGEKRPLREKNHLECGSKRAEGIPDARKIVGRGHWGRTQRKEKGVRKRLAYYSDYYRKSFCSAERAES